MERTMKKTLFIFGFVTLCICPLSAKEGGPLSRFPQIIGKWDQLGTGKEIIIDRHGDVFGRGKGTLQGTVDDDAHAGGNFQFSDTNFYCSYHIAVLKGDQSLDFELVDSTPGTPCPRGIYTRSE
jgi:hypothetical protein